MITTPACGFCKHFLAGQEQCKAFPNGIPTEILQGYNGHRQPYPGDHGVQFEVASDVSPALQEALSKNQPEPLRKAS